MTGTGSYLVELKGKVDLQELNAFSPVRMALVTAGLDSTSFTLSTDQSGLIGLLRLLHARGIEIMVSTKRSTAG